MLWDLNIGILNSVRDTAKLKWVKWFDKSTVTGRFILTIVITRHALLQGSNYAQLNDHPKSKAFLWKLLKTVRELKKKQI